MFDKSQAREADMTKRKLTVDEAAGNLSSYLNRVSRHRETFVVFRNEKPVAELCPVPHRRRLGDLPEILASVPALSKNEAKAFVRDIEAAREELRGC